MNLRTSVVARLITMGVLMIALMVPLMMVQGVVSERATRRSSVVEEVSGVWGGTQMVGGPVLAVPYRFGPLDEDGRPRQGVARAYFLPETLAVTASLEPEVRQRGLFRVVVYKSRVRLAGRFTRPDLTDLRPAPAEVLWGDASINVGVADPRGIAKRVTLRWNGGETALVPGVDAGGMFDAGLRGSAAGLGGAGEQGPLAFDVELDLNGTRELRFLPSGSETTVTLSGGWPHASFVGAPLPSGRETTGSGFSATWTVPYFARGYPSKWSSLAADPAGMKSQAATSSFGVALLQPVDVYQQAERAVKYAPLFIVLTFVVFFLWETVRARLLHPIQYLFVGFAMCVFYLLLVSVSEHVGFDVAYFGATAATTLLIAMYSVYVLGGIVEGSLMAVALGVLYGFLYLLLRLEDYALLAGSIGLFAMLALLMLCTRRVNWYDLRLESGRRRNAEV